MVSMRYIRLSTSLLNSRSASGDGDDAPVSQRLMVTCEPMPKREANCAWVKWSERRMRLMAEGVSLVIKALANQVEFLTCSS